MYFSTFKCQSLRNRPWNHWKTTVSLLFSFNPHLPTGPIIHLQWAVPFKPSYCCYFTWLLHNLLITQTTICLYSWSVLWKRRKRTFNPNKGAGQWWLSFRTGQRTFREMSKFSLVTNVQTDVHHKAIFPSFLQMYRQHYKSFCKDSDIGYTPWWT